MFPVRWMEKRMFDHWTLSNGLHVVGERLPYLRSVSIGVWLRVGSMMEQPRENGLSHFLEHMVFKGTEKRNTRQIAEEMDAVGGQLNAFTGKDCTCFYAKVIDEDLPLAVDILSDMTLHATLDEGELNKERGVILEEISMEEDSPEDVVHELLSRVQFGDQAAGMPILGPAEQIAAYTRGDLAAYRAKHYHPENCVVALAGNYEPEKVLALNDRCRAEMRENQDFDALCVWLSSAIKRYMNEAFNFSEMRDADIIHRTVQYMQLNYGAKTSLEDIARSVYLSPTYLCRLFKRKMGVTIMQFYTTLRIDKCKDLLTATDLPLSEIAQETGFGDQSHFTKVFKRTVGMTPLAYRRKARREAQPEEAAQ